MLRLPQQPQAIVGFVTGRLELRQANAARSLPLRGGAVGLQRPDLRLAIPPRTRPLPRHCFRQQVLGTCCKILCGDETLRVPRERAHQLLLGMRVLQIDRALTTDTSEAIRLVSRG